MKWKINIELWFFWGLIGIYGLFMHLQSRQRVEIGCRFLVFSGRYDGN